MIGAISNPTRELTVSFTNEQVQTAMSNLSKFLIGTEVGNYLQHEYDGVIGQLELLKTEFLSLGVSIIVSANAINDKQTRIFIEVRRAMGSFDKSYEVSEATHHIDKVVKGISTLLSNPEAINKISVEKVELKTPTKKVSSTFGKIIKWWLIVSFVLVGIGLILAK
tara:strand:+ start:173 stop:670 length:498 start_codon:yes stop_codon:yes gene_type:complete